MHLLFSPEDELVLVSSFEGSESCEGVSWVVSESTDDCFCCCWSWVLVVESDVSPVSSLVFPENEADFLWHSFNLPPSALDLVLLSEDCGRLVVLLFRLCVLWWFWRIFSPFSLIAKLLVLDPDKKSITPCSSSNEAMEGDWSFDPVVVFDKVNEEKIVGYSVFKIILQTEIIHQYHMSRTFCKRL